MRVRVLRIGGGVVLVLLGALWALQGADLVHMNPILCFANCEPLVGGAVTWLIIGLAAVAIGGLVLLRERTRSRPSRS